MRFLKTYKRGLWEYSKYSMIGLSCAIIDLGVLNGLLYFFPSEKTSTLTFYNTTAYGLAVLNSYVWNSKYTFKSDKSARQFIVFLTQALASLLIANVVFIYGLKAAGLDPFLPKWAKTNVAKAVSMFLSSTASFFFNKFVVFRKKPDVKVNLRKINNDK